MGWVGLGFSPTGGMTGADIVMAWVDNFNMLHFTVSINFYFSRIDLFPFYHKSYAMP